MEHTRGARRCRYKQERQSIGTALMLTSLIRSEGAPYVQNTRLPCWLSPCCPETSSVVCGRRLQPTTSTTKAKSTCLSVICLVSTPSYLRYPQNLPIPFPKSFRNSYPSMDHPAASTPTRALHLHPVSSCSSYNNNNTLIILPHPHTSPIQWIP